MKELQNGRSMIEMLGVLAIIGVLSIGGLAGYTMAMNRHRANTILDYASRCVVVAQTNGDGSTLKTGACKSILDDEAYPGGATEIAIEASSKIDQPVVTVTGASPKVLEAMSNRSTDNVKIDEDGTIKFNANITTSTSTSGTSTDVTG